MLLGYSIICFAVLPTSKHPLKTISIKKFPLFKNKLLNKEKIDLECYEKLKPESRGVFRNLSRGGLTSFSFQGGGAQHPLGNENHLKSIDFTGSIDRSIGSREEWYSYKIDSIKEKRIYFCLFSSFHH